MGSSGINGRDMGESDNLIILTLTRNDPDNPNCHRHLHNQFCLCRNHRIRAQFINLLRRTEDDVEKQRKLAIIAEQQRQTISALDDLTKKLTTNFKSYRENIDTAIKELKAKASTNDESVNKKLDEMTEVTGRMRWVMNIEDVVNHGQHVKVPQQSQPSINGHIETSDQRSEKSGRRSPTKLIKHRRKDSIKVSK